MIKKKQIAALYTNKKITKKVKENIQEARSNNQEKDE